MEGLIGLLFFLIALYLAYLLILLIVGLFLDIIKGIWDFIVGIVTEVWNFFTIQCFDSYDYSHNHRYCTQHQAKKKVDKRGRGPESQGTSSEL